MSQGWATERPPTVRRTRKQAQALRSAVGRLLLSPAAHAVLDVHIEHVNGAGYCFLSIQTMQRETGYSRAQVFRALKELRAGDDDDRLLDRTPFLRTAENTPKARTARGRRGQGASTYRLGPKLRAAAGLYEVADETPQILAAAEKPDETPRDETPKTLESPCTLGGLIAVEAPSDETPERWNERKPSSNGAVGVGHAHAREDDGLLAGLAEQEESDLAVLIERARQAAAANERRAGRDAALRLADELPDDEGALVLELVEQLDAVLLDDDEPTDEEIVVDLRGGTL